MTKHTLSKRALIKRIVQVSAIAAFGITLLTSAQADAFGISTANGYVVRWPSASVGYQLNSNGSDDIGNGADLTAVREAIASWNEIGCSNISLWETGTTIETDTVLTTNYTDGINRFAWVEDSEWGFGQYVLGVTSPVYDGYGEISEADVAMNGYLQQWSTSGQSSRSDIESVAVHELGHFIGIQHVLGGEGANPPPTMSPSILPFPWSQSLEADDKAGACFLYASGSDYACESDCDCPAVVLNAQNGQEYNAGRVLCQNNACTGFAEPTPGELGESCSGGECATNLFCVQTYYGNYCSQDCNSGSDCPSGFDCYDLGDGSGGCMSEDLGPGSGGESCIVYNLDGEVGGGDGPSCSCDTTWGCDAPCNCDPECTDGGGGSGGVEACACDDTNACDQNDSGGDCSCDSDCGGSGTGTGGGSGDSCECDLTYSCDGDCACDPECGSGCGASTTVSAASNGVWALGLFIFGFGRLVSRRRKS